MAMVETEKELEDYIYEIINDTPDKNSLSNDLPQGKVFRQVDIGVYGIIDLLVVDFGGIDGEHCYPTIGITIIELKKNEIDHQALEQISKYKTGIEQFLEGIENICSERKTKCLIYTVECLLIGSIVNKQSDFVFLLNHLEWLSVYTYSISLKDGMSLDRIGQGWQIPKENFSSIEKKSINIMPCFLAAYKIGRRKFFKERYIK